MHQALNIEWSNAIAFDHTNVVGNGSQYNDPMVIIMDVANVLVHKVLIDNRSLANIIFLHVLHKMKLDLAVLQLVRTLLVGFGGSKTSLLGTVDLLTSIGNNPCRRNLMVKYLVVDALFTYNMILRRLGWTNLKLRFQPTIWKWSLWHLQGLVRSLAVMPK